MWYWTHFLAFFWCSSLQHYIVYQLNTFYIACMIMRNNSVMVACTANTCQNIYLSTHEMIGSSLWPIQFFHDYVKSHQFRYISDLMKPQAACIDRDCDEPAISDLDPVPTVSSSGPLACFGKNWLHLMSILVTFSATRFLHTSQARWGANSDIQGQWN